MVAPASREESREHNGVVPSSWLKPPLPLADGMMLATASWTDPAEVERLRSLPEAPPFEDMMAAYRLSFDLFDAEGRYLTSLVRSMADMGLPDEVDAHGNVYANVMDPFPHVRRYRVVIEGR
jgi:hypothetical protein